MPGTLLLRADASAEIGTGHVMRCLALAQAWQDEGGRVLVASAQLPAELQQRLEAEGADFVLINALSGSTLDAEATASLAADLEALVVVDGYQFGAQYQQRVRATASSLLVVDDFVRIGSYEADFVVDQNVGASAVAYEAWFPSRQVFVGPTFALLRRGFRRKRIHPKRVRKVARSILIAFGGSDPAGATVPALKSVCAATDGATRISVLVGWLSRNRREVERAASMAPIPVDVLVDVSSVADVLRGVDLAITAAGSATLECACMGVPTLLVAIAENQRPIAAALEAQGVAVNATSEFRDPVRFTEAVEALCNDPQRRKRMSRAGQELVDGEGAVRVVQELISRRAALA